MKGESSRKSWIGRGFRVIVTMTLDGNQRSGYKKLRGLISRLHYLLQSNGIR